MTDNTTRVTPDPTTLGRSTGSPRGRSPVQLWQNATYETVRISVKINDVSGSVTLLMHAHTMRLEVEERRQEPTVGEASVRVTELVKERVNQSIQLHEHHNIVAL